MLCGGDQNTGDVDCIPLKQCTQLKGVTVGNSTTCGTMTRAFRENKHLLFAFIYALE